MAGSLSKQRRDSLVKEIKDMAGKLNIKVDEDYVNNCPLVELQAWRIKLELAMDRG